MKSLKMTDIEATHMTSRLAKNAGAVGVSSSKMAEDFQASFGYLSMYGDRSVEVFEDLAAQAANAGIEIAKMLEITKAFDKFSSGAEKAARMNAVFGTNISAMALMTMDAGQRMEYLTEQVQNSVGSLEALSQAQKLSLTESMGFGNVAEMMAALGANTKEAHDMRAKMESQGNIEQDMANALEHLLPVGEQITAMFNELAANKEVIEGITEVIQYLASAFKAIASYPKTAALALTGLFIAMKTFTLYRALYIAAIAGGIPVETAGSFSTALLGQSFKKLMIPLLIATAALGILFALMHETHSPANYLIAGVMAIGVFFLAKALKGMTGPAMLGALAWALWAAHYL